MDKFYRKFIFCFLKKFVLRGIKLFIISFILAYAFTNKINHPSISDNLIESIYYNGKNTSKITYDELKSQGKVGVLKKTEIHSNDLGQNIQESNIQEKCIKDSGNFSDSTKEGLDYKNFAIFNFLKEQFQNDTKYNSCNTTKSEIENLYSIYGTKSIYNLDIIDLENFVDSSILTEKEASLLWNSLIKQNKIKQFKLMNDDEFSNKDIYLLRFIPIKSVALFMIIMMVVGIIFRIAKINFISSLICMIICYYMVDDFYKSKYYNISVITLGSFVYCVQQFYYQSLNYIGFSREDYEITNNKAKNVTQFILKFILLLLIVIIIGLFTFLKYDCFLNYFVLYFGIVKLILLIAFYINLKVSDYFQPIFNVLIMLFALINFFITNFHTKIKRFHRDLIFSESNIWKNLDGFYLISQAFSIYSMSYFYEFLFLQSSNVSKYLVYKYTDTEKFFDNLEKIKRNYREQYKYFTKNDCLWLIVFLFGIIIFLTAIYNNQYLTFVVGLCYIHVILNVVNKIFKTHLAASIFSFLIFLTLLMNELMCIRLKENLVFLELSENIESYTGVITKEITSTIVKILGIFHLLLLFFFNREFLCDDPYEYLIIEENTDKIVFGKKEKAKLNQNYDESFDLFISNFLDFISNYYNISCFFFLILHIEKDNSVLAIYYLVLSLLIYRAHFFLSWIEDRSLFILTYLGYFLVGIRMLAVSRNDEYVYIIASINFFSMIIIVVFKKGDYLFSCLIILISYIVCNYLNSNCLFILILIFFVYFKFRDLSQKYHFLILIRWNIPVFFILVFNYFSIHKFFYFIALCNEPLTNIIKRDYYKIFYFMFSTKNCEIDIIKSIYEILFNILCLQNKQ